MQENKIRLPNRYNNEVYLEKIKDNKYKIIAKKDEEVIWNHMKKFIEGGDDK